MNFIKTGLAMASAIDVRELMTSIQRVHWEEVLGSFGLEKKPSASAQVLPAAGLIAISALVGAGVALLLAPTSGTKLRARLYDRIDDAKHRLSDSISQFDARPAHPHSVS